jgi:BMFP domain-containing protein YqiC
MAAKARAEQEALAARLAALESRLAAMAAPTPVALKSPPKRAKPATQD